MTADANGPRPLEPLPRTPDARTDSILRVLRIIDRLRAPDGCPWDLEQTVESLAPAIIEEAHELVEAIEQRNEPAIVEEAGDVLVTLALICQIASQEERFDIGRAAEEAGSKLVRRHPHVFGSAVVEQSDAVLAQWEQIKQAERAAKKLDDTSRLAGVPQNLPALQRAQRLGNKAMSAGFRWEDAADAMAKVEEEARELRAAFEQHRESQSDAARAELVHELGDVLLAASQFANYVDLDAESAARSAARRFEQRFRYLESALDGELEGRPLNELMRAWNAAKQAVAQPAAE